MQNLPPHNPTRLLCEIFIIGGLLYLGWEKPFKEWIGQKRTPAVIANSAATQPILHVSPIPSPPAWMRDPNHRTALDSPTPIISNAHVQPAASASGSWMFDPNRHSRLDPTRRSASPH
jgi:hypothetical protein